MIRKDFKYKTVKNFLTPDELILLKDYCIIKHRANETGFDLDQTKGEPFIYGDPVMESLLLNKRKKNAGNNWFKTSSHLCILENVCLLFRFKKTYG